MKPQISKSVSQGWGAGAIGRLALADALVPVADGRAQSSGGYLGVTLQEMDDESRSSYGLRSSDGVLISEVQAESPADKAVGYTVVVVLIAIVVGWVASVVTAAIGLGPSVRML